MKPVLTGSLANWGNRYGAGCFAVDIASRGETLEEAVANLREALDSTSAPDNGDDAGAEPF